MSYKNDYTKIQQNNILSKDSQDFTFISVFLPALWIRNWMKSSNNIVVLTGDVTSPQARSLNTLTQGFNSRINLTVSCISQGLFSNVMLDEFVSKRWENNSNYFEITWIKERNYVAWSWLLDLRVNLIKNLFVFANRKKHLKSIFWIGYFILLLKDNT